MTIQEIRGGEVMPGDWTLYAQAILLTLSLVGMTASVSVADEIAGR